MNEIIRTTYDSYSVIPKERGRYLQVGDKIAARHDSNQIVVGAIISFGGGYSQTSSPYSLIKIESPPELVNQQFVVYPSSFLARVT